MLTDAVGLCESLSLSIDALGLGVTDEDAKEVALAMTVSVWRVETVPEARGIVGVTIEEALGMLLSDACEFVADADATEEADTVAADPEALAIVEPLKTADGDLNSDGDLLPLVVLNTVPVTVIVGLLAVAGVVREGTDVVEREARVDIVAIEFVGRDVGEFVRVVIDPVGCGELVGDIVTLLTDEGGPDKLATSENVPLPVPLIEGEPVPDILCTSVARGVAELQVEAITDGEVPSDGDTALLDVTRSAVGDVVLDENKDTGAVTDCDAKPEGEKLVTVVGVDVAVSGVEAVATAVLEGDLKELGDVIAVPIDFADTSAVTDDVDVAAELTDASLVDVVDDEPVRVGLPLGLKLFDGEGVVDGERVGTTTVPVDDREITAENVFPAVNVAVAIALTVP